MKSEFSTSWIGSSQPRKQRKYRINAPLHLKREFLISNLSKELRKKHGQRNLLIRKGDEVLVMRGSFKKKKAKVLEVDMKRTRVVLEGITRNKRDGTKVPVFFNPSKIQIVTLNVDDRKRLKSLRNQHKEEKHAPNKSTN